MLLIRKLFCKYVYVYIYTYYGQFSNVAHWIWIRVRDWSGYLKRNVLFNSKRKEAKIWIPKGTSNYYFV